MDVLKDIDAVRAKRPLRRPTVLSFEEVMAIIDTMPDVFELTAKLIYGCGLRGIKCVRMRVNDVDFGLNQIMVRDGKGRKDRVTMLPEDATAGIQTHLKYVKHL